MEFNLNALVRPNILSLAPYSSARSEFSGTASVWLDANESPFNGPYNRYPDPLQKQVKERLSAIKGVAANRIFLGNGSDECIDLMYRVFCEPKTDNVVAISPSYGMYEVCADINDVEYRKVPLRDDFSLNAEALIAATDDHTKVIWICSPNNPTGNAFSTADIERVLGAFEGIVVVDEAYGEFSSQKSMRFMLDRYPNLLVMQTFSKAWGSAGVRLGMAFASEEIIALFNKVKYPYNVNMLTQQFALKHMDRLGEVQQWIETLLSERTRLIKSLNELEQVEKVFATDANFVLVRVVNADAIYSHLQAQGIIVRNRNKVEKCLGCLRITVGTESENNAVINGIKSYGTE
ncbi:MAG: histidinol-phosphate transaminase [Muribaculaceae bacterium]|nr:histidinol-phosphate transaminase [Muribaculaceae bacterium]